MIRTARRFVVLTLAFVFVSGLAGASAHGDEDTSGEVVCKRDGGYDQGGRYGGDDGRNASNITIDWTRLVPAALRNPAER